jgi:hypothetical protein
MEDFVNVITPPKYFVLAGNYPEYQQLIREFPEMKDVAHYIPRADTLFCRTIPPRDHPDRPLVIFTGTWESLPYKHRMDILSTLRMMGFKEQDFKWL